MLKCLLLAIVIGSWNLKYFPSGRAEHRASPRVESANVFDAADQIRAAISNRCGVVLAFQEVRDASACSNLLAAIGRPDLQLVAVTESREQDRRRCWQQTAIVSDLPVLASGAREFVPFAGKVRPPRGFCYAVLHDGTNGPLFCAAIHLKSNYGAKTEEHYAANRTKRAASIEQVLDFVEGFSSTGLPVRVERACIAGDFNADAFSSSEPAFDLLLTAGFKSCFTRDSERGTHPGTGRWPDSTLDYVFARGMKPCAPVRLLPAIPLSDHRMLVGEWR